MQVRRAELLDDLVSQAQMELIELGVAPDVAQHAGHALADHLADHWGGQVLSFPKDASYRLSQREREILTERRNGASIAALAARYDMGERGIRKLLKRAEQRDADLNQPELQFGS